MSQESSGPEFRVYHRGEEATKSLRVTPTEDGGAFVTFGVRRNEENADWDSRTIRLSRAEVAELALTLLGSFLSPTVFVRPLQTRVEREEGRRTGRQTQAQTQRRK